MTKCAIQVADDGRVAVAVRWDAAVVVVPPDYIEVNVDTFDQIQAGWVRQPDGTFVPPPPPPVVPAP